MLKEKKVYCFYCGFIDSEENRQILEEMKNESNREKLWDLKLRVIVGYCLNPSDDIFFQALKDGTNFCIKCWEFKNAN